MANHAYSVEVQSDFLEKITRAKPVQALAEFIWNSLDADASIVDVSAEQNELGAMSKMTVRDNGTGMEYEKAPEFFKSLGGSWKRSLATTKNEGRFLHGQDGRGRFKAFALGRVAEWDVTYRKGTALSTFAITMTASNMKEVLISDEAAADGGRRPGVTLTISELHKDYRFLSSDAGFQELTEIFALYLSDYKNVAISIDGRKIDPSALIASQGSVNLSDVVDEGKAYPVRLDIIEWRSATNRALYLCNEKGFPLAEVERRFHVGAFQFSAYVKSEYISKLQKEGTLELAEMSPTMVAVADEAQEAIREYFRKRAAQEARTVVEEWKESQIYPYEGEATTRIEEAERQVFDIVAVTTSQYLPDFSTAPPKNRAFHLRLLRQAIEKSPEDLQLILGEVLKLPKRKQEELAGLLRDVSLSAIISAAKIVADRLRFLTGLEAILFDAESKKRLKERSQLHRIVAQNCWLFGEEYNLSVDDKSLTEVLRKHRQLLGDDAVIDEPVKHVSQERGIVDLVFSRAIRRHKADELTHLVVELKAPKVKIDEKEITQTEKYAISVMKDERFKSVNTTWVFWAISDDYGEYAEYRMKKSTGNSGKIHEAENVSIWVKTWAQVLEENRTRLQFFQERLEYEADKGASLKHLQEHYAKFLEGVLVEEPAEGTAAEGTAEPPSSPPGDSPEPATT
ncbi:MAG TPA: ATP-binding protein [Candidatus Baltobacteraceae bacterium]|nr:ATP-binding protein [Candidatus Baltobacteraceae bacterium]